MNKEQQAEAAARILAKGPLTAEERKLAEFYKREPGGYIAPAGDGTRTCGVCGAKFRDTEERERVVVTALEKFCDHVVEHNPTADRWAEAHRRIRAGKDQEKKGDT